jgi:murein DD-endopeptidase MepM/ murein hydrolase activator NlpD
MKNSILNIPLLYKKHILCSSAALFYILLFSEVLHGQHISSPLPQIKVTSNFGYRIHPIYKVPKFHYGVDLFARADTVKSILQGAVVETGFHKDLGYYLVSKHGEIEILYAHLSSIIALPRDSIYAGDYIGISGATGNTTGEHLHLSVKILGQHIDPLKFLKALYHQFTTNNNKDQNGYALQ